MTMIDALSVPVCGCSWSMWLFLSRREKRKKDNRPMGWPPQDACITDPKTGLRQGPGTLSFFVWILFAIGLALGTLVVFLLERLLAGLMGAVGSRSNIYISVYSLLLIAYLGMYVWFTFQQRCRPWTGFLLYVVSGMVLPPLVLFLLPRPEVQTDEARQKEILEQLKQQFPLPPEEQQQRPKP